MRTRRAATITDLRRAVDCLPRATRIAMLEGIRSNAIIVGAYTGPDGICPMLAAHRAGADLFLTKPFSPLHLLRLVDDLGASAR